MFEKFGWMMLKATGSRFKRIKRVWITWSSPWITNARVLQGAANTLL